MSRHSLFTPGLVAGALSIGSTLALSTALAGEFPQGTFEAKEAPYTVSFDGKGRFQVNQGDHLIYSKLLIYYPRLPSKMVHQFRMLKLVIMLMHISGVLVVRHNLLRMVQQHRLL